MKKNFKKLVSVLICIIMCLQVFPVITYAEETSIQEAIVEIGCSQITDAVQIADSADLLIVDGPYKTLYKASFLTGDVKSVELEYTPNSVDYRDDKIYVGCGIDKVVLIYDINSLELTDTLYTEDIFSDMVSGYDGYIYVIKNRVVIADVTSYSVTKKCLISTYTIGDHEYILKHPDLNIFYLGAKYPESSTVTSLKYKDGKIIESQTSYGILYSNYIDKSLQGIDPYGEYCVNGGGYIFKASSEKDENLAFLFALNKTVENLCFDKVRGRMLTVSGRTITQYNMKTFMQLNTFDLEHDVDRIYTYDGQVATLYRDESGLYCAEVLNYGELPYVERFDPETQELTKTDNIWNLELESLIDGEHVEETGEFLLLSESNLYKINLKDGMQTKIKIPYAGTRLAVYEDRVYVAAGNHGAIYVYSLNTMNYIKTILTESLFLGMEIGNDGFLYTGGNRDYHSVFGAYDISTGVRTYRETDHYNKADYIKVPGKDAFYYYNSNSDAFFISEYDNGVITDVKRTNSMGTSKDLLDVSPDGKYIVLSSGNFFEVDYTAGRSAMYHKTVVPFVDARFAKSGNYVYAATEQKQIQKYDYNTFDTILTYETLGYPKRIFETDAGLVVISSTIDANSNETGSLFIETIDLELPNGVIGTTATCKPLIYENGRALLSATNRVRTVFNGDIMYIADKGQKAVYVVDTAKMTETKISFAESPNSLYYYNGELYVGFGDNWSIVILDAETFSVKKKILTKVEFLDMVVGHDGYIYVSDEKYLTSISPRTGEQVTQKYSYPYEGYLQVSPTQNALYFSSVGVSPADIHTVKYKDGEITAFYDSPYHGTYPVRGVTRITPDGERVFNGGGYAFSCSEEKGQDMQYRDKFLPFVDITFDFSNNQIFASHDRKNVYVYDYTTFEPKGFIKTQAPVINMALYENKLIALSAVDGICYLEILDASDVTERTPEKLVVNIDDVFFMYSSRYKEIRQMLLYNDETSEDVTGFATCTSSDESVVKFTSLGAIRSYNRGHATLTIEYEGFTKTIDVYVDATAKLIEVEGYDIEFHPLNDLYVVILDEGTTKLPTIKAAADDCLEVNITYPDVITEPAYVTVGIGEKVAKEYKIYFMGELKPEVTNPYPSSGASSAIRPADSKVSVKVSYETNGGSVIDDVKVEKGGKLTAPPVPVKEGYIFDGWYTDAKLTKEYDFDKAASKNVTLYAKWTKAEDVVWTNPFADVTADDWFYSDVEYALKNKLFQGTAEDTFSPELPMTRAMLVTVIYRMAGSPAVEAEGTFGDVAGDAYYYDAVAWAAEKGVVTGVGDNLFAPDAFVTREQIAVILQRYLKYAGIELSTMQSYAGFADEGDISDYAKDAVKLMNELGIINGKDDSGTTKFAPTDNGSRAELAAMLHRLSNLMQNN